MEADVQDQRPQSPQGTYKQTVETNALMYKPYS